MADVIPPRIIPSRTVALKEAPEVICDSVEGCGLTILIPAELAEQAGDIRRFVDGMVYKLARNSHKAKDRKWANENRSDLLEHINVEIRELVTALAGNNSVEILLECCDVANFALILANTRLDDPNG